MAHQGFATIPFSIHIVRQSSALAASYMCGCEITSPFAIPWSRSDTKCEDLTANEEIDVLD